MKSVLQVFAKAPVPGQCKTRLIPALGAAGAARLHERLVLDRLAMARAWQQSAQQAEPGCRVELWCAPDLEHAFLAACLKQFKLAPMLQTGPDLGVRMWLALCGALARGERPVLIGTDCPWLGSDDITAAFAALDQADAVYAPAHDGGYVLTGLARAVPELFANIVWGTAGVMAATRKAAARTHTRVVELRTLHDLDTPADLARVKTDRRFTALLDGLTL